YFSIPDNRELTLKEIVSRNLHNFFESSQYINNGIKLIENTPEEIYDVVIEMFQRLNGNWESQPEDDQLQKIFWMRIPQGDTFHGEFKGMYGAAYLRKNVWWLS
ncbi:TIGR04372 family glycosyltransferase, partial [Leptospira borgpetersenii serovar Hardjo-bovis]|uniref:TIGR04372 family glycosyltransferase n=1 Tax=Leptospira borgpetersenii TaxID=174 RepID=UPI00187FBE1E